MTAVGKKFPNLTVNAMNEMGDTFSLNILDQAVNKKKKFFSFGIPKILLLYVLQNYTLFKKRYQNLRKETQLLLVHHAIQLRFILHG